MGKILAHDKRFGNACPFQGRYFSNESGVIRNIPKKYNRIPKDIQTLGFLQKRKTNRTLPYCDHSFGSGYSNEEKAKTSRINQRLRKPATQSEITASPPVHTTERQAKVYPTFLETGNKRPR
jgi:hypothetical protein